MTTDAVLRQLQIPKVWLGLGLSALVAYALYRFGRMLLRVLERHLPGRVALALGWLWGLFVVVGWLAVGTHVANLPGVPVLYDLGQDVLDGLRNRAGQFVVILALGLVAWHLIGALTGRIVADEAGLNRRTVRVRTLRGVVDSTLKVAVVIISLIAALQVVGVNPAGLLAGVSVLGLAVGFGAQSLIKDVFTGFFILLEDQYGIGDTIAVNTGQLTGTVERLNLRVTVLRALDGTVHIVPNSQINTVSVSSKDWSRVVAEVMVTGGADLDRALAVLQEVGERLSADPAWKPYFLEAPEVQGVTRLAPEGVTLRALFKVLPGSQYPVGREFYRRVKLAMDEAGVRMALPAP